MVHYIVDLLVCGVRLNTSIIQHTYTSFTIIAHRGLW
jgi:hypothetical protein